MNTAKALELYVAKWQHCTRCGLHKERCNVVLGRGELPCDICFIGEAPGDTEDSFGQPFRGEAGRLLEEIIGKSVPAGMRVAITNILGCIPKEDGLKVDIKKFDLDWIKGCAPRLQEFVRMADPKLIVTVGKLAQDNLEPGYKHSITFHREIPQVHIVHPAAILRQNVAQQGVTVRRCVIAIQNGIQENCHAGPVSKEGR